jgi:hypothetical protein
VSAPRVSRRGAAELDGELLRLCREFTDVEAEFDKVAKAYGVIPSASPEGERLDAEQRVLVDRIHALRGEISDIAAHTPEGIMAKAKVALYDLSPFEEWPDNNETWMALSVLSDIVGRTV